jgi:SNF2 family DNA or RNA helicase
LSYLKIVEKREGPSLIVVPLSVLTAWCNEFKKWSPTMRVLQFHSSDMDERERIRAKLLRSPLSVDVVVTTYEMMVSNNMRHTLSVQVYWRYVVMDEGHKVKNELSGISQQMAKVRSEGRIILTGTPLQNNLHELWAMLRYLEPDVFEESEVFDNAFDLTHNVCDSEKLDQAGTLLRIFQLRRLKVEVEKLMPTKHEMKLIVKLSDDQKFWAKRLLARDARMLVSIEADLQGMSMHNRKKKKSELDGEETEVVDETENAWKRMNGLLMQLRKVCNHPYLLPGADPTELNADGSVSGTDESIVTASSKMILLDRLLER